MASDTPADGGTATASEAPGPARTPGVAQVGLIALFVTALVTAQVTATKVLMFELPVTLPVVDDTIIVPGGVVAIAVLFFATDCYAELYGRRPAQRLVNVGFFMNFVLLALVWATIFAPTFPGSPVSGETFRAALGPSTGVVIGSLVAYLVSQNWDVVAFHRIREYTGGEALWLRNLGSTATSQFLDAAVFIAIAFVGFQGVPLGTALSLFVGQYLFRLGIAVVDTPFVYAAVGLVRGRADTTVTTAD
jgi:uncharacterized integral membrane protein (TIGR00697 family)